MGQGRCPLREPPGRLQGLMFKAGSGPLSPTPQGSRRQGHCFAVLPQGLWDSFLIHFCFYLVFKLFIQAISL